ncbi:MAG TPA: hypothetical protein V6D08_11005 [Candidatus Obscuribacterales bacterium]
MADPLESARPREARESTVARLDESFEVKLAQELFRELDQLMRQGVEPFGGGIRPPGERDLMAGVSPEQGAARLQGTVDEGVRVTPELYQGGGGDMRAATMQPQDTTVMQQTVDTNVQQTQDLYREVYA